MTTSFESFKKRQYEMAVKRSISMPAIMFDKAISKTRQKGFSTFSDYIQDLIRKDNTELAPG